MFLICSASRNLIESTWEITNYGRFINQFPSNIIRSIRQFERINKKICRQKMPFMFNEICINEEMLPIYIYIYIYIYRVSPPNFTSFHRPIILAILVEITLNFNRMYRNNKIKILYSMEEDSKCLYQWESAREIDWAWWRWTGFWWNWFLWGYVKGLVYVSSFLASIDELKLRITSALDNVTGDMLQRVWQELNYRLNVCRVTGGAHIE